MAWGRIRVNAHTARVAHLWGLEVGAYHTDLLAFAVDSEYESSVILPRRNEVSG